MDTDRLAFRSARPSAKAERAGKHRKIRTKMPKKSFRRASAITLLDLVLFAGAAPARADVQEYEFLLLQDRVKQGDETVLAVRLVHKPTGTQVPEAVIFARRLDMAPDGMRTMTADLEPLSATEPGVYRFKTTLTMEGNWQLSLAAKVQGEPGTLQNRLTLRAKN